MFPAHVLNANTKRKKKKKKKRDENFLFEGKGNDLKVGFDEFAVIPGRKKQLFVFFALPLDHS